jgi:hypothetical protein
MYNSTMPILLFLFMGTPLIRDSPNTSVERFYSIVLSSGNSGGFPSLSELDQLAPHMSKHLMKLFLDAKDCIVQFEKDHPPEPMPNGLPPVIHKPPFSGGSIFSSNAEGATSFRTKTLFSGAETIFFASETVFSMTENIVGEAPTAVPAPITNHQSPFTNNKCLCC